MADSKSATVMAPAPSLLERLAMALEAQGVSYCQWKGHWTAHRWMAGLGDIDLLVAREAGAEFRKIIGELGFKPALPPGKRQMPGVESYFGFDPAIPRLLHLHVHYGLVLGDYWRTSNRIPLEAGLLASAARGDLFPVPAPTHQFLIFVLRTALMQRGRLLFGGGDRWRRSIQIQLDNLEALCNHEELAALLTAHLPTIDVAFLHRCVGSLRGRGRWAERALLLRLLRHRLRDNSRRPPIAALLQAAAEKLAPPAVLRRIADNRMRLAGGGTVIALVGGDGAGKSTCADELEKWLSTDFATLRVHLGNPPRSLLTLLVGGALKVEQVMRRLLRRPARPGTPVELLRHLCTARDRYRLYGKVQRFAARGGIVVSERYPLSEIPSHVGPCIPALVSENPTGLARIARNAERWYYERMRRPDLLFVLRLDPDVAVVRKPGEPAEYVRTRGRTICETEWGGTRAQVLDAGRPLPDVLDDLKSRIWLSL